HWIVGFDPAKTLNALPSRDSKIRTTDRLMLEHVHERCFTYPCFARYEDRLSTATQRDLQIIVQPAEAVLTPHNIAGELSGGIQTGPFAGVRHGSYEPITPLRERPNECG